MIFVTLGTQKFQMNRLIKAVDDLAKRHSDQEFFIQIGHSDYIPKNAGYERFVSKERFDQLILESDGVISHSGVGSIMSGVLRGKKVIVVPRLEAFGEHVDDHQVEIAEAFDMKGFVRYCKELAKLDDMLGEIEKFEPKVYDMPTSNLEDIILDYINE